MPTPNEHWQQRNIFFRDRATAQRVIADRIAPALIAAEDAGELVGWWYMNKQPWPLRYRTPAPAIDHLLDRLTAKGHIDHWAPAIYEPETIAFGGTAAMDAAHTLFHHDSRHLLTYPPASHRLGRRETAVLLSSAMMRAAAVDRYEQGDVWAKVADLRPAPPPLSPDRAPALTDAMRRLMTADVPALCRPGGPLHGHNTWVSAFEALGKTLADLAHYGRLTRGLRAVLAHHVIFHANRAGLPTEDQSTMSALARDEIMGTSDSTASSTERSTTSTSLGAVNTDTISEPDATALRLRNILIDQVIKEGRVRTPRVEAALRTVPRHLFVPEASIEDAYANSQVHIKHDDDGTSISCASQPSVVALMLEQLQPEADHKVLELGAGSGYNAALLAALVGDEGHVTTLDVDDDLVDGAREHLAAAGSTNVTTLLQDGALGYQEGAPYDRIIATVGAHGVPHAWMDQLAPGGRLLVPQRLRGSVSRSIAYECKDGRWLSVGSAMNTFMPLRRGIADDVRRRVLLAADGSVRLQTHADQIVDVGALTGVLDQPRSIAWSGVMYRAMESPEWMELYLTCVLPSGLSLMLFPKTAKGTLLTDDPYPSSTACFDKGAFTYLTRRLSDQTTPEGGKLWEFGVAGHGRGGDDLAAQVAEAMRTWDREFRGHEATFEIQPLDSTTADTDSGTFAVSTPLNRIFITWH